MGVEESLRQEGFRVIAGVDESGRGPLAGPVLAAAVILPPEADLPFPLDSKRFTPARRERLFLEITAQASAWAVSRVDHGDIDRLNILRASLLAMAQAVSLLPSLPDLVLVDGNACPALPCPARALVGADRLALSVGAASIIAKVERDLIMDGFAAEYPLYGFLRHRGYGTPEHLEALRRHGPCPIHRRSFAPIKGTGSA